MIKNPDVAIITNGSNKEHIEALTKKYVMKRKWI